MAEGRLTDTRDTVPRPLSGQDAVRGLDLFAWTEQTGRSVAAPTPQNPCKAPADPPPEALQIRDTLIPHVGRDHAITAPQIAQDAGLWPDLRDADRGTKVRELIATWYETMLQPGLVLVSTSSGFFHTSDPDDLTHYDRSLLSRIRKIALRDRRVRMAARTAGFVHHGKGNWARR